MNIKALFFKSLGWIGGGIFELLKFKCEFSVRNLVNLRKTLAPWYPHVDDELGGT